MKYLKIVLVGLTIVLASAALAPLIHDLFPFKFERILSRLVMVFSLIAIFLMVRIRARDLERYGLGWNEKSRPRLLQGFLMGFATLALATGFEVLLGGRKLAAHWDPAWRVAYKTVEYLAAALLIGTIEEFFFRGLVLSKLRGRLPLAGSLVVANGFYAALHFFRGGYYPVPENPSFVDSFQVLFHLGDAFLDPVRFWPAFLGLFLFGWVLSYAFLATGSLFLSIGIHAGCVFFLKIDGWFVESVPHTSALVFGDKNLYSGLIGWILLVFLLLALRRMYGQYRA